MDSRSLVLCDAKLQISFHMLVNTDLILWTRRLTRIGRWPAKPVFGGSKLSTGSAARENPSGSAIFFFSQFTADNFD